MKLKTPKVVTINVSKWRTGAQGHKKTGTGPTRLLNSNSDMCCLGFLGRSAGIPKKELIGVAMVCVCEEEFGQLANHSYVTDSRYKMAMPHLNQSFYNIAQQINDDEISTVEEKKKRVKEHFLKAGIRVRFTNQQTKTQ